MTGNELKKIFEQETDLSYTAFYDDIKLNRWFKKAIIQSAQDIYLNRLNNQNAFDELNFLIATDQTITVNNNQVYTAPLLLANVTIAAITGTFTTELPHNLLTGNTVTTSGIAGFTTNPNGTFVITVTGATTFTAIVTASAGAYTANTGYVTSPVMLSDYYHYLFGSASFTLPTIFTITGSTNATPIVITINKRSYFKTGSKVLVGGIAGNTNANGTFFLKQYTDFTYGLYTDSTFQTPAVGNGAQTGTGTISELVTDSVLKFKRSDEKGTILGKPTVYNPFFQQSKLLIKILPATPVSTATFDYIRVPPQFVNVADTSIDMSSWYPLYFQYLWISEVGKMMALALRDGSLAQGEQELIVTNP